MSSDRIEELLRKADAAAGPPPAGPADLPNRVRHLAGRRRVVRITSGAAIAAMLALAVGTSILMTGPHVQPTPTDHVAVTPGNDSRDEVVRLRAEIKQLRAEADDILAAAKRMLVLQKRQTLLAELERIRAQPDPIEQVRQQMDKAAFIIVYQADRMYRELNLHESAIESYQQAITLFPETHWAAVARERLAEIENPKGDQL